MTTTSPEDLPRSLHVRLPGRPDRRVILSNHARERIAEMGCTLDDVARVSTDPTSWYRGSKGGGRIHRREDTDIAVVYDHVRDVVITVLWNTTEQYSR